jgi:hypothetical protein
MKKNGNVNSKIPMLLIGIVGSILFIYMGYLVAGIIGFVCDGMGMPGAMATVITNPFSGYFNSFTPIMVVMGFIFFEAIFMAVMIMTGRKHDYDSIEVENELPIDEEIIEVAEKVGIDNIDNLKFDNADDMVSEDVDVLLDTEDSDFECSFVIPDEDELDSKICNDNKQLSFSDDIVNELMNDYNLAQITAMLKIQAYMVIEDASLLKRMFRPSMPAETITSYINAFYGEEGI